MYGGWGCCFFLHTHSKMKHFQFVKLGAVALLLVLLCPPTVRGQGEDCPMLLESELGDTTAVTGTGLLADALSLSGDAGSIVQLLQFNIVCLAQGTVRDTYRSLSLIAEYRDAGGTVATIQLHLQCVGGTWSTRNFGSSSAAASTPTNGTLTTTLRTDCFLCLNPSQGGPEGAHHCLGELDASRGIKGLCSYDKKFILLQNAILAVLDWRDALDHPFPCKPAAITLV